MKKNNVLLSIALVALMSGPIYSSNALADKAGNGGDIACDAKIKSISANIRSWIQGGGPEVGKLDLSSSVYPNGNRPYALAEYDSAMLDLFKLPLDSSCVTKGDSGYPVQVGDDSKVCASFVKDGQVHMKCDQIKLLGMNADEQIEQIHHEFATNISGLEPDYGSISTYKISTQLSAYTENVSERRLVVAPPIQSDDQLKSYQEMTIQVFTNELESGQIKCTLVYGACTIATDTNAPVDVRDPIDYEKGLAYEPKDYIRHAKSVSLDTSGQYPTLKYSALYDYRTPADLDNTHKKVEIEVVLSQDSSSIQSVEYNEYWDDLDVVVGNLAHPSRAQGFLPVTRIKCQ